MSSTVLRRTQTAAQGGVTQYDLLCHEENGTVRYGIEIRRISEQGETHGALRDVFGSQSAAAHFLDLLVQYEVLPVHLPDIYDDMKSEI